MNFKRGQENKLRTIGIGRTVWDELKFHKICSFINTISTEEQKSKDPNKTYGLILIIKDALIMAVLL